MAKPYRILSLDGGGIRGLISAIWLKHLQEELDKPLHNYFDMVAGTSTGALLGCAVSKGMDVERIISLYETRGSEVFPSGGSKLWSRATRLFSDGVSAAKYDGKGLERALNDVFRTSLFRNLKIKPTLVTTYDVLGREAVVFKNTKKEHQEIRVADICRASAAAPTFFPSHVIRVNDAELPLVDGGVVANNPTACAIAEARKINGELPASKRATLDDFVVASFGTGESTRPISIEDSKEWGALEWAQPIVDVLFDGSADAVDYITKQLVLPKHYFRFQTRLTDAYDDMDNADATNLNALKRIAGQYITGPGEKQLADLAKLLKESEGEG